VLLDHKVQEVLKEIKALLVHKDLKEQVVILELLALLVLLEVVELLDHKVLLVLEGLKVYKAPQVLQEHPVT
jgi:hypothetical protein